MGRVVFEGSQSVTLDGKGRIALPKLHLEPLRAEGVTELTITKNPDGALMMFPPDAWAAFRDKLASLPVSAIGWKRLYLGNAQHVSLDGAARLLIAPELRASAGLKRDVLLLGMGNNVEVWDAERYAAHETAVLNSPMPDVLKDFSY